MKNLESLGARRWQISSARSVRQIDLHSRSLLSASFDVPYIILRGARPDRRLGQKLGEKALESECSFWNRRDFLKVGGTSAAALGMAGAEAATAQAAQKPAGQTAMPAD